MLTAAWKKLLDRVQHSRGAQATLLATTLVGAAFGLQPSSPQPELPTQGRPAATAVATAAIARPVAFDPCTLVTLTEAGAILEKSVTTQALPPPSAQCTYKPQSQVVFTFAHPQCGADGSRIRIDDVVLTFSTGADAAERYAAKDARFGRDPLYDQRLSGLGDKAVVTGTELSVLQGPAFLNVKPSGTIDCAASGLNRFEDVYQKYVAILTALARPALPRLASAAVTPAAQTPSAQQTQVVAAPPQATPASQGAGPNLASGLAGGIAGLALGALTLLGLAAQQARAPAPTTLADMDERYVIDPSTPAASDQPDQELDDTGDAAGEIAEETGSPEEDVAVPQSDLPPQVEQPTLPPGEVFTPPDLPPLPTGIETLVDHPLHPPGVASLGTQLLDEGFGHPEVQKILEELERLQDAEAMTGEGVAQPDLPPGETFTPQPKGRDVEEIM